MRIAIGQLWQETNTLNPLPTTRAEFEQFGIFRGAELVERMANTNELGGFIQAMRRWPEEPDIVGLVRLPAWPSGRATPETFDWLCEEMLDAIRGAGKCDALLLALHGAMAADGHPDVEGEILAAVRRQVGKSVPIVATLDLHANVTSAMVEHADVLVPYHTMPHVDIFETGQRGAQVLHRILVEGARPVTAFQKIPAVVPAERSSTEAPGGIAADLKRRLIELESQPRVLACGMLPVQPWLDIPEFGSTVLVTTDNDPELASESCAAIADEFWERRKEYLPKLHSIEESVRLAHDQHRDGLVVLSDPADATTSGAPGDSVWILQELLQYEWLRPVLVTIVAPKVVAHATQLGVGSEIETELGGLRDRRFGTRIPFRGVIERLFPAKFVMSGHIGKELSIEMGPSAVLKSDEIRVIVTTHSGPHFAPELFRAAGFDPFAASVVVAKSPCGFRAVYEQHAIAIYSVKAPGCAPTDFWNYEYPKIPHPLWPWDEVTHWKASPTLKR
jgi:microcystin degradation protein MlrC